MIERKWPWGKPYDLAVLTEWTRLLREVSGYLWACRKEGHGTDYAGRMHAIEALGGMAQAIASEAIQVPARRWRHVKSGGGYAEITRGILEADAKTRMVVYVAEHDQRVWIRPEIEFDDGRFVEIKAEVAA